VASLYTIIVFGLFEKKFIDGARYRYKEVKTVSCNRRFEVWGVRNGNKGCGGELVKFKHVVSPNSKRGLIKCTCMEFIEIGILCSHCLRVLHVCCVGQVLDHYVVKRWCKGIKDGQLNVLEKSLG